MAGAIFCSVIFYNGSANSDFQKVKMSHWLLRNLESRETVFVFYVVFYLRVRENKENNLSFPFKHETATARQRQLLCFNLCIECVRMRKFKGKTRNWHHCIDRNNESQ